MKTATAAMRYFAEARKAAGQSEIETTAAHRVGVALPEHPGYALVVDVSVPDDRVHAEVCVDGGARRARLRWSSTRGAWDLVGDDPVARAALAKLAGLIDAWRRGTL